MSEQFPIPKPEAEKMTKAEYIGLAKELSQNPEGYVFSGLDDAAYAKLKATDEEYPGFTTPIDELIKRFTDKGIKVALSADQSSGNVYILPKDSDDLERDSVFPRHLRISDGMDQKLKKLVQGNKDLKGSK